MSLCQNCQKLRTKAEEIAYNSLCEDCWVDSGYTSSRGTDGYLSSLGKYMKTDKGFISPIYRFSVLRKDGDK